MSKQISLVLFDKQVDSVSRWKSELNSLSCVTVVSGSGPEVTARENLDAIFLTWMQAADFGAKPPFPVHEVRVMETPIDQIARGFPKFIVAGVALKEGESREPKYIAGLILRQLVKGINAFNDAHETSILRVGTVPQNLGLDKLEAGDSAVLLHQELESHTH